MKHLIRFSLLLMVLFGGSSLVMGQSAVKQLPDDAKIESLQSQADDALNAKLVDYRQKMGFNSFPGFTPTGNPEADMKAYTLAKSEWIATHSLEYQATLSSSGTTTPADAVPVTLQPTTRPE